jgi:hypothetical protein
MWASYSDSEFENLIRIDTDNGDDDGDAERIFSGGLFSRDVGNSTQCKMWGHCTCPGNSDNVNVSCDVP